MKRSFGAILIGTSLLCGCGDNSGQPTPGEAAPRRPAYVGPTTAESQSIVATINGEPLTLQQLMEPLIESHGLTMLSSLVELDLAKQAAAKAHVTVSQEDFDNEYRMKLEQLFHDDVNDTRLVEAIDKAEAAKNETLAASLRDQLKLEREDYFAQVLEHEHKDRTEIMIGLKIDTYVRKVAEPQVDQRITEAAIKDAFGQLYGERIEVEYILLPNMAQVGVAQRRLANGDSFEQVAQQMSTDARTAPSGGALPPFTRESKGAPDAFKQTAFSLRDGQVSDVVTMGSSFSLIKRLKVDPPEVVTFAQVHDSVKRVLHDRLMEVAMGDMKKQLLYEARTQIDIVHPVLAQQWQDRLNRESKAAARAKQELDKEQTQNDLKRLGANKNTTGTAPGGGAAQKAAGTAAGERPPATQPGETSAPPAQFGPDAGASPAGK